MRTTSRYQLLMSAFPNGRFLPAPGSEEYTLLHPAALSPHLRFRWTSIHRRQHLSPHAALSARFGRWHRRSRLCLQTQPGVAVSPGSKFLSAGWRRYLADELSLASRKFLRKRRHQKSGVCAIRWTLGTLTLHFDMANIVNTDIYRMGSG